VPSRRPKRPLFARVAIGLALPVASLGAAVAVPGAIEMIQTAGKPQPITEVPADQPEIGLVYTGLTPAKKGSPCVGSYQVSSRTDCTHGPDQVPPGLDVRKDVPPVAPARPADAVPERDSVAVGPSEADIARDENGFTIDQGVAVVPDAVGAAAVGASGVVCEGDGVSGKRIQVLYVRDAATASRYAQYAESFRTMAAGVDVIYDESANANGGSRHLRYVTRPDCTVDVPEVEVPAGAMANFGAMTRALRDLGFNRTDRKYMIFGESKVYCGIGSFAGDDRPGANNRSNSGPSYGRSDSGCWSAGVAAHELGHNLGAVNDSAPNSSKAGHCTDDYDLMCYNDGGLPVHIVCGDRQLDQRLDCNHDDYYNANPAPGSYLASHWNVASNQFLINGSVTPPPPAPPAPPPPPPSPSASPSPSGTPSPSGSSVSPVPPSPSGSSVPPNPNPDPTLKALRVTDTTPTSTRLSWDSAGAGVRYAIMVNGRSIGGVTSTAVRIVGMRPGTEYRLSVAKSAPNGALTPHTVTVTVTTPAVATPAEGRSVVFTNALSSRVADLYGGRAAAGTPLVLDTDRQSASQQWTLEKADGGTVRIVSKASRLCVAPRNDADTAGTPLVQSACATAMRWRMVQTPYGTALTSPSGLVIGVGGGRYADSRLLVLQRENGARYQSWAVRAA
jgi:hypothetical protein